MELCLPFGIDVFVKEHQQHFYSQITILEMNWEYFYQESPGMHSCKDIEWQFINQKKIGPVHA